MRNFVFAAVLCGVAAGANAQTDVLYTTDGSRFLAIQGGSVIASWNTAVGSDFPFAVQGTLKSKYGFGSGSGAEYTLTGGLVGTYGTDVGPGGFDGTTDGGSYNYATQNFCGSGQMWRYDRNWQNSGNIWNYSPTGGGCGIGVTYDRTDGTLWTLSYGPEVMDHWDLSGNNLGSFSTAGTGDFVAGLALEPSTDTLWGTGGNGNLYQWSKSGTLLQSFSVAGMGGGSWYSAEFEVPAPGSLALLGLGGPAAARRRR